MAYIRTLGFRVLQSSKAKSARFSTVSISALQINAPSLISTKRQNQLFTDKCVLSVSVSKFSTQNIEEGSEPLSSNKKPVELSSQKLPLSLRSLLERRPKDSTFPKLFRLSKLSREFSFVSVTIDETGLTFYENSKEYSQMT